MSKTIADYSKMSHDNDRVGSTGESIETNRRTMLRLSGATAAGVAGLAATSGSASAQWSSSGVDEFDLDGIGAADELPNSDESELVICLHGGVSGSAVDQAKVSRTASPTPATTRLFAGHGLPRTES